jgi:hypothetical protein
MEAINKIKDATLLLPENFIDENAEFEENLSLLLHQRLAFYIEKSIKAWV